jgi:hypothetical protein
MIVPFDDLELVYQSLRTLELPHTHKFPRVNAQDSKLGPIQPWDVKDFLRPDRGPRRSLNQRPWIKRQTLADAAANDKARTVINPMSQSLP